MRMFQIKNRGWLIDNLQKAIQANPMSYCQHHCMLY